MEKKSFFKGKKLLIFIMIVLVIIAFNKLKKENDKRNLEEELRKQAIEDINKDLEWPTSVLGVMLPKLENQKGEIIYDNSDSLSLSVYKLTSEDFKNYINKCKDMGFVMDYQSTENSYEAKNDKGYVVRLFKSSDEPKNTLSINLDKEEEIVAENNPPKAIEKPIEVNTETEKESNKEPSIEPVKESEKEPEKEPVKEPQKKPSKGIRPEIKKAVDSYEGFMNEYAEFIKKYKENSSDAKLLADYSKMMLKYSEFSQDFDKLDDGTLTDEETKYYNDASIRASVKLIELGAE